MEKFFLFLLRLSLFKEIVIWFIIFFKIFTLLLLPSIIKIISLNQIISEKELDKFTIILQSLQQLNNYNDEFNTTLLRLLERIIYIVSS